MATDTGFGRVELFDDFLGDVILDQYSTGAESGGSAAITAAVNGVLILTTHSDNGDRTGLTHQLNWQASDSGPLVFEARIKSVTDILARAYFLGFTDVLASSTTVENPIEQSGGTLSSAADNAVGFMYDTASDNDTWHGVGTKSTVDATKLNTGEVPAAAGTWETLRVVVDVTGSATFFINGVYMGAVADAVTSTTDLTPIIMIETRDSSASYLDIDYLHVIGGRT